MSDKLSEVARYVLSGAHYPYCRALATGEQVDCDCKAKENAKIADLQARLSECERANTSMHESYLRIRNALDAWRTPFAPSAEQVHAHTETCARVMQEERDTLRAQLAETQRMLEVQLAAGDKLQAEVVAAKKALLAPGVMHCAKCQFELTRVTLYVGNGTVGAGDSDTEPCPNGCGPLWPVTWEARAREQMVVAERFFDEKQKAEAELAALRTTLEEVDKWDLRWADGLDSNVERIKSIVRDALGR